jgi:ADP-ribosylglycohydrolase
VNPSRVASSAIWAAYGDALGFITEFRDAAGMKRKFSADGVTRLQAWERRVGGKFGPTVELPLGCYSDDTQLRLATSRSIRGDGTFDVEAFAKVELPVWLSYHLGAGRGTKAAARNLERKGVTWYSNFFVEDGTSYLQSGGNGAAMRIQPHVWAEPQERKAPSTLAVNVFRNAITTHGHPRGFLGALFHAQCLSMAVRHGRIADPNAWMRFTDFFDQVPDLVRSDDHLERVWRPTWEQEMRRSLRDSIRQVQDEHLKDIRVATDHLSGLHPREAYGKILREVGGLAKETAGSGTKTALLAAVLAFLFKDLGVEDAILTASNEFGSDTDTIATMTGALLGTITAAVPATPPLDAEYLIGEAARLVRISQGQHGASFVYPDLLYWRAPKTQLDAVGLVNGSVVIAGLGPASPLGRLAKAPRQSNVGWEWLRLSFGQTVLAKRRAKLTQLPLSNMPQQPSDPIQARSSLKLAHPEVGKQLHQPRPEQVQAQPNLFDRPMKETHVALEQKSLDRLTDEAIRSGFHPVAVGKNLIELIDRSLTPIEDAIAYAAILAKARVARLRARSKGEEPPSDGR